jgi:sulfonate transport system substrate-binding protein
VSVLLSRRAALSALGGVVSVAAYGAAYGVAYGGAARGTTPVLRLGDQKGGLEALLRAAGQLDGLPYRIEIAQFQAAAPLLEALNAGAVDIAFAGDAPTTFALANGTPAHIVSAHRSNGAGTALLVKPDSPVRTVADLQGRRIGTSRGSIGQALVLSALRANTLPLDAVKFAYLLPAEAKSALVSGGVDAWATWGVFVAQARLVDQYRPVVDGSNGILTGLGYLSALDTAIADRRPAVRDLIARAARAALWANAHVDDYARSWAGQVGVAFDVARLSFTTAPTLAVPIDAGVIADQQRTADLYTDGGLIARHIDVRGFFDASFNDAVLA